MTRADCTVAGKSILKNWLEFFFCLFHEYYVCDVTYLLLDDPVGKGVSGKTVRFQCNGSLNGGLMSTKTGRLLSFLSACQRGALEGPF